MPFPRYSGRVEPPQMPGELGALDGLESAGADDAAVVLGDPHLHVVPRPQPVQDLHDHLLGLVGVVPEHLGLHGAHRSHVVLVGDPAHHHPVGQLHVDGEQPRLADHDRLRLVGHEPVGHQGLVQAGCVVVPAGLPLDADDVGVGPVVGQGLLHEPVDRLPGGRAAVDVEVLVGDEAAAAEEGGEHEWPEPFERGSPTGPRSPGGAARRRHGAGRRGRSPRGCSQGSSWVDPAAPGVVGATAFAPGRPPSANARPSSGTRVDRVLTTSLDLPLALRFAEC